MFSSSFASAQDEPVYEADSTEMADLQRFSDMIVDSVSNGYLGVIAQNFDKDTFFQEIWSQLDSAIVAKIPIVEVDDIKNEIFKNLRTQIFPFSQSEVRNIDLIDNYWSNTGRPHLVYRYVQKGFSYMDIELVYDGNSFKVADLYLYPTSSYISTIIKEVMVSELRNKMNNIKASPQVEFTKKVESGDLKGALSAYESIPEEERKLSYIRIVHIKVLRETGDIDAAEKECEQYNAAFPYNIAAYMQLVDIYSNEQKYKECLTAIDSIDSLMEDSYMNFYRAIFYKKMGDVVNFRKYALAAMDSLPAFHYMHLELIDNANELKDKETMKAILEKYGKHFFIADEIQKSIESSIEFMKGDAWFKEWILKIKKEKEEHDRS